MAFLDNLGFAVRLLAGSAFRPMTGTPQQPVVVSREDVGVTFIGHSSFLIQIGGLNLLVDPVFARFLVLLRRARRPGVKIKDLPPIDAVLLTHAHMDHLNLPSLRKIIRHTYRKTGKAPAVIIPAGVEDLVEKLGFSQITSLRWWESTRIGNVEFTMTPAKHWGARMFKDTHRGYGGYVMHSGDHVLYHSGDTAYFDGFHEISNRLKPSIALLPIGAYYPDNFRTVHTSPEDALQAFLDLRASVFIPMHFGTFKLSAEPMEEPVPRLLSAARQLGIEDRMLPLAEGETRVFPGAGDNTKLSTEVLVQDSL